MKDEAPLSVKVDVGIAEEHALGKRRIDQPLGKTQRGFVGEPVRNVPELAGLLFERADHRRMRVPKRRHCDAAREVDIHPSGLIPDPRTFAAHRNERRRRETRHHHLVERFARDRQFGVPARNCDVSRCRRELRDGQCC